MEMNDKSKLLMKLDNLSTPDMIAEFNKKLDHGIIKKTDVVYRNNTLILKISRNLFPARKRRFPFPGVWWKGRYPTVESQLTIENVEDYEIRNEDKDPRDNEVVIGGLSLRGNKIYIGSFCEQDNAYGISVRVSKTSIELKDI
jgi:hypothetical protein